MPRSNSDADENDSLTSEDEAGPAPVLAPVQTRDGLSPKSQTFTHQTGRTNRRRPTMPTESFQIDRSAPPIEQFRMAARKARLSVMKIRKAHIALKDLSPGMGGEMQGSTMYEMYGHRQENCKVHVWDYGPTRAVPRSFDTNFAFKQWLEGEGSKPRGVWNKVRWINISGLSWDILSELQLKYDLHPLSLDVVMNGRDNARSKADYFVKHLFIHILSHTLAAEESPPSTKSGAPLSQEPEEMSSPRQSKTYDPEAGKEALPYSSVRRRPTRGATLATLDDELYEGADLTRVLARGADDQDDAAKKAERNRKLNEQAIDTLKQGTGQIKVDVKSVFMFLLRDGTLITIQRNPAREFGKPIYDRLRLRDTLLRSSGDASLLLQSLIDLIVDEAVKVTDKYHRRLLKMERDILMKTKMRTVRDLHIASGDLTLHKRTLAPIAQLVYGLRRYDLDRCKAVMPPGDEVPTTGFLSHQAKVYLADVHDHIEYIISSLDMFSSIAENLINYTFNLVSYETNQVMRGLTVATVIFFPLTFLTGYFGMNFEVMPSVQKNSDKLFWYIAGPVMFVVITLFLWPDIRRFMHFLKKRAATSQFDVKKLKSKTA